MITREIEQACMASLDRWMIALNAHDVDAMDKELHFPHVRLAEGRLVVYERPGSNPMDLFTSLIQKSNWDHSTWTKRVPVQSSDSKVHWAVEYKRFTKDEQLIGTYDSLYVMTLKNGNWKTQIRSSFGP
jgi:hypothetical protein